MTEQLPKHYSFELTEFNFFAIQIASVTDSRTGIKINMIIPNKHSDVVALFGYAGARFSRDGDGLIAIMQKIENEISAKQEKSDDFDPTKYAAKRLAKIAVGYGHASVAGMSSLNFSFENISMEEAFTIFNKISIGDGQELSTRYVDFDDLGIPSLKTYFKQENIDIPAKLITKLQKQWDELQSLSAQNYKKWKDIMLREYTNYLEKELGRTLKKSEQSSVNARSLDVARLRMLYGTSTAMYLVTSVRMWTDIASQLHDSPDARKHMLAEQIETMLNLTQFTEGDGLNADVSGLAKYAEGRDTIPQNLQKLRSIIETIPGIQELLVTQTQEVEASESTVELINTYDDPAELMIMHHVLTLYPSLKPEEIIKVLQNLTDDEKETIGNAILNEHMHHNLMRNQADVRSGEVWQMKTALAYIRDYNRHRAYGRFAPIIESRDVKSIVNDGFTIPMQLAKDSQFEHLQDKWIQDMKQYYTQLKNLYDEIASHAHEGANLRFLLNVLPLGHQAVFHMSGPLGQENYFTSLRFANLGGDFGYRHVTELMLKLRRNSSPYFKTMHAHIPCVDSDDVEQILGRG